MRRSTRRSPALVPAVLLAAFAVFGGSVLAATTDSASSGVLELRSAEIVETEPGVVDLRVSDSTAAAGSSRNCQNATDYVDDTTTPFIVITDALRGATETRSICVKNVGDTPASITVDLIEAIDVEVGPCLVSETDAGDATCGDGDSGELAAQVKVEARARAGQDPAQPFGDSCDGNQNEPSVTNPAQATASSFTLTGFGDPVFFHEADVLAAGDAACVDVTLTYDAATPEVEAALAQTDRAAVRLRFNGEPYLGGGEPPTYAMDPLYESPNQDAITRAWWAPGLNTDGFVPQGLGRAAAADSPYGVDTLLVSGYYDDRLPLSCGIYAVEEATGIELDVFDALPAACNHGDGVTFEAATGSLWLVEGPNYLYEISFDAAFVANDPAAVTKTLVLTTEGGDAEERNSNYVTIQPTGSFARQGGGTISCPCLLSGDYQVFPESLGFYRRYELSYLHGLADGSTTAGAERSTKVTTPYNVQGAAVDATGAVWLSRSLGICLSGACGALTRQSGGNTDTYDFVRGGEGIVFSGSQMWGVGEQGAKKYANGGIAFPLLYRFDPAELD